MLHTSEGQSIHAHFMGPVIFVARSIITNAVQFKQAGSFRDSAINIQVDFSIGFDWSQSLFRSKI